MTFPRKPKRRRAADELERLLGRKATASAGPDIEDPGAWLEQYLLRPPGPALKAVARATYGYVLAPDDLSILGTVTRIKGTPKASGYTQTLLVVGRRGGKSSGAGGLAVREAVVNGHRHMAHLQRGQRGHVVIVSRTQRQAIETFRYCRAIVEAHFTDLVEEVLESQSGGEIRFKSGVVIAVWSANASSLRGYTVLMAIVDEAAHLGAADEESERGLEEILSTLRFAMLAPKSAPPRRLWIITSPGIRSGYVYEQGMRHLGNPDAPMLVAHGASYVWNPSLSAEQLEEERARDPRRYLREVEAHFVDALNPLLDGETIVLACEGRHADPLEPGGAGLSAGLDIGLKRDSTALVIAARADVGDLPKVVVIGCWRWSPSPGKPLDVAVIVRQVCEILSRYGCSSVVADQFSFCAVQALFAQHGVKLTEHCWTAPSKMQKFGVLRDMLAQGRLSLPAHQRLVDELRSLDETILPSGTVRIAARGNAHDDCAFACALAVSEAAMREKTMMELVNDWDDVDDEVDSGERAFWIERARQQLGLAD